ncbi:MAG: aldehyde dehydrogenase [Alphaproteobacteria bacterium]|nr:aldehyde dehydrogenase [Alphaproteobacteria bacterium]
MSTAADRLDRRALVSALLADRGGLLVIAGLGSPAWDITAAGDTPLSFPLWGAMGGAAMIGMGVALAQPARRVLVISGDGEMLMGAGALATIGAKRPANLAICVLDNGQYGETGGQATHTALGVDLAGMARAAGFPVTETISRAEDIPAARRALHTAPGPVLVVAKIATGEPEKTFPSSDGAYLKSRFRHALLGAV